jgi:hypothetical protein
MMALPETGLSGMTKAEHEDHHETLHDLWNKLVTDASVGDVAMKVASGTSVAGIAPTQPHYMLDVQVQQITHAASGVLAIVCTRFTRVVIVTASAAITGLTVTGLDLVGAGYAHVDVWILATVGISVSFAGSVIVAPAPPATLGAGVRGLFRVARFA